MFNEKVTKMFTFSREDLITLAKQERGWALSLYTPLHSQNGERRQDAIRLRNLLRAAEQQLTAIGASGSEQAELLSPARELAETMPLWESLSDGLALFSAPAFFRYYPCPIQFQDRVIAGRGLHVKPLLPLLTELGIFYLLILSENHVALLRGTHETLTEVPIQDMPHSLKQALESDQFEKQHHVRTIPPVGRTGVLTAFSYGQEERTNDEKERLARFFAMVSRSVSKVLYEERAPLVAAGVDYLVALYRQQSDYPGLCDEFIHGSPDARSTDELHQRAKEIAHSRLKAPLEQALDHYRRLGGTGRASHALNKLLPAAFQGRIDTLFLQDGVDKWGYFHPETGTLSVHNEFEGNDQELLNLAALRTLLNGGQVYLLGADDMPTRSPAAAILRY